MPEEMQVLSYLPAISIQRSQILGGEDGMVVLSLLTWVITNPRGGISTEFFGGNHRKISQLRTT